MYNKRKILVTGGMGYIGSHTIISLWENGFEPIIIDNFSNSHLVMVNQLNIVTNRKNTIYRVDCTDKSALNEVLIKEKNIEGIIHFAAFKSVEESIYNSKKYYTNNIQSLFNVLDLAKRFNIKNIVFSSSCTVYGNTAFFPVNEYQLLNKATSPYGHTKQLGESMVERYAHTLKSFNAVSLRYFNPVGAHPSGLIGEMPIKSATNLFPALTKKAINGEVFCIKGNKYDTIDGTCIRDFIHVMDLAEAHVKSLQFLIEQEKEYSYESINIGSGKGTSVLEIVKSFQEIIMPSFKFKIEEGRPGDIPKIYACTNKSKKLLNWSTTRTIRNSIIDQWNWEVKSYNSVGKIKKAA
jgi:UDP-glucose 4-epimerase